MPTKVSATQMSLKWLKKHGYEPVVVEQTIRFPDKSRGFCRACNTPAMTMFKRDLWNIADILAVRAEDQGVLLVQTTTTAHGADRYAKIKANPIAGLLLKTGNKIHVHGWAKQGARGKRKLWTLKIYDLATDTEILAESPDSDDEPGSGPTEPSLWEEPAF